MSWLNCLSEVFDNITSVCSLYRKSAVEVKEQVTTEDLKRFSDNIQEDKLFVIYNNYIMIGYKDMSSLVIRINELPILLSGCLIEDEDLKRSISKYLTEDIDKSTSMMFLKQLDDINMTVSVYKQVNINEFIDYVILFKNSLNKNNQEQTLVELNIKGNNYPLIKLLPSKLNLLECVLYRLNNGVIIPHSKNIYLADINCIDNFKKMNIKINEQELTWIASTCPYTGLNRQRDERKVILKLLRGGSCL